MRWLMILLISAGLARAEGERAGDFDYYVLALSWSPSWCAREGDARDAPQCSPDRDLGWTLHGLWPQYESGWPSFCRTPHREATRGETRAMADIMGSSGLAWHQLKKHGRCSGLTAREYFDLSREAFEAVNRPQIFRKMTKDLRMPASVIEEAFLKDNPDLSPDMVTITCKDGRIQEARICLTRDLEPRQCGADVRRDCSMDNALMAPIR